MTFRASMGKPEEIRAVEFEAAGEPVQAVSLLVGNPQCVLLGDPLEESRFMSWAPRSNTIHGFPIARTCRSRASKRPIACASSSGSAGSGRPWRRAPAPAARRWPPPPTAARPGRHGHLAGGTQRVEWLDDGLYLTGWATLVFEGKWLGYGQRPAHAARFHGRLDFCNRRLGFSADSDSCVWLDWYSPS